MPKKHTISALVENHFGVLCRISGLFSSRGFNIDGLSVGETEDPSVSRMTIVVRGDDRVRSGHIVIKAQHMQIANLWSVAQS